MAQSIGGQIVIPPDLTNAKLLADVQFWEQYTSGGLNRKFRNILLPGIYKGFEPQIIPNGGMDLLITSGAGGGACSLNVGDRYQLSAIQLQDVTITLKAGTHVYVALEVNYDLGTLTDQVDVNSVVPACHIVTVDVATGLAQNQLELCEATIPSGASQLSSTMISLNGRIMRNVGLGLTDRVDWDNSDVAASAKAVKLAYDKALQASGLKLGTGDWGIGAETIPVAVNFDWQTYLFHGDEYVFINWALCANNPGIDYPPGYYQISVIGISNTKNQSLMIRPVNYLDPLAPYMISWTGDVGQRVFKWRAVTTSMNDINMLGNVTPNTLKRRSHAGVYNQPEDAQATIAKGYPVQEAGSLRVEPSSPSVDSHGMVTGGIYQEYTTFTTGRKFTRAMLRDGSFTGWTEYANLANNLLVNPGRSIGVAGNSDGDAIYLANDSATLGGTAGRALVNAVVHDYGQDRARVGIMSGANAAMLGYSVEINGVELLRIAKTGGEVNTFGNILLNKDNSKIAFRNTAGTSENASISYTNSRLLLSNSDGSSIGLLGFGMVNGGVPVGDAAAILRGTVEGGTWDAWRSRSSGLQIDLPDGGKAYNVWKATLWGVDHAAAMTVAGPNGNQEVQLKVGSRSFSFRAASGTFAGEHLEATVYMSSAMAGHGGYANQVNSVAPFYSESLGRPNADNTFYPMAKTKVSLVGGYPCAASIGYTTKGSTGWGSISIVADTDNSNAGLKTRVWTFDVATGNFGSPGAISAPSGAFPNGLTSNAATFAAASITNLQITSTINIGDNDSGFYAGGGDGTIYFRCNSAYAGYINSGELYHNGNGNFNNVYIRSDARYKRKLKRISNVFQKLKEVSGYMFEIQKGDGWEPSGGVIAQHVMKSFPELVQIDPDGALRVNYNGLIGVLCTAVNQLVEDVY
ncbi:tail fiber domain-containing protein [Citrobacter werkmanii]|uniref:tail fiber domain-containing protein n=1 Tax=Citrobacter werkmanii TaxID=67827 RepID=UPI0037C706DA